MLGKYWENTLKNPKHLQKNSLRKTYFQVADPQRNARIKNKKKTQIKH